MVREARTSLIKKIYENPELVRKFEKLVGAKLIRMFSDINIGEDIAMTIFVFDGNLEEKSRWKSLFDFIKQAFFKGLACDTLS